MLTSKKWLTTNKKRPLKAPEVAKEKEKFITFRLLRLLSGP